MEPKDLMVQQAHKGHKEAAGLKDLKVTTVHKGLMAQPVLQVHKALKVQLDLQDQLALKVLEV